MLTVLLALASLAGLAVGIHYLRQSLAVTSTATSYIRSAAQGYVVLEGVGSPLPGQRIVAPLSGKPCVWWATQVEMLGRKPVEVVNSHAFDRHTSATRFMLKDGTGECVVDPDLAEIHVATQEVWYGSTRDGDSRRATRGLEDDCRYVEQRIELHQRIVASGYLRTLQPPADAGTHEKDAAVSGAPGTNLLCPPSDGRPFVLSTVREDELARSLRLRAALALVLCTALGICALIAGRAG